MRSKTTYSILELCHEVSAPESLILEFLEREWILRTAPEEDSFDEEDLYRLRLILELKNDFDVNDEGVDLILHLVDQMHSLHKTLRSQKPPSP